MIKNVLFICFVLLLLLNGIHLGQSGDPDETLSAEQWLNQFKNQTFTGSPIEDYRLMKAPLTRVIQSMSEILGLEIEMNSDLDGEVTFSAKNIPWDKALYQILKSQGLTMEAKNNRLIVVKGDIIPDSRPVPISTVNTNSQNPSTKDKTGFRNPLDQYKKKFQLEDPILPDQILANEKYLYIAESEKIHIYKKNDMTHQRVFGKRGQGPEEFQSYSQISGAPGIRITLLPKKIFVGSLKKFSFFTLDGKFLSEKVTENPIDFSFSPIGKNVLGIHQKRFPKWWLIFTLFDAKGQKIKEICSRNKNIHTGKRENSGFGLIFENKLSKSPQYAIHDEKIFTTGSKGFTIDIFDKIGNPLGVIRRKVKQQKITSQEKEAILGAYKEGKSMERLWPQAKKIITIPDFYPAYRSFIIADKKVYVQTYLTKNRLTEFLVFDTEGKYLSQKFFPILYKDFLTPYPYTIFNGVLYQLYDNQDTETWELVIAQIR